MSTSELQALVDEQRRLRGDIERLLDENRQLREKANGNGDKGDRDKKEDEQKPKEPLFRRARRWGSAHPMAILLIVAALVVLVVCGYMFMQYLNSYVSTDDAQIDGHIHQIGSRVSSTVTGVYIEDNRSVVAGQTLVDLDPRDYQAALSQAQANLAQAQAALEAEAPNVPITQTTQSTNVRTEQLEVSNAAAAVEAARQSYESAVAEVREAEVNAANAQREEERYRVLMAKDEISRELYDQKATQARSQAALVTSRKAAADSAQRVIEQRQAGLNEARERAKEVASNRPRQEAVQQANVNTRKANVRAAQAQVDAAALNLTYCKIVAPVAGIIGNKTVEVGQQVAPGQELFAITPVADLWITANFKETQIQQMHPGQRVTLHVDALDLDFNGYVENLPGATGAKYSLLPPENATGNYIKVVQRLPIRLRFKPGQTGEERLRPGMSVEPKVWVK